MEMSRKSSKDKHTKGDEMRDSSRRHRDEENDSRSHHRKRRDRSRSHSKERSRSRSGGGAPSSAADHSRRHRHDDHHHSNGHSKHHRPPVSSRDHDQQTRLPQDQSEERAHNRDKKRDHRRRLEEDGSFEFGENIKVENEEDRKSKNAQIAKDKDKPDFEVSGNLTKDTNMFRGVVIKYNEPPEARIPKRRWRLYPFKGEEDLEKLHIHRQSAYLLGRDRHIADIPILHPSCSKQHAVFQYRLVEKQSEDGGRVKRVVRPYIIDLGSSNGTYVNNNRIDAQKYVELMEKDVLKFGFSSREYVLLHENSKGDEDEVDEE